MARLTDRGFTEAEADEFTERASGSHSIRWTADVYRWVGGAEDTLAEDLPIVGGTLVLDASDPTRRRLTVEVGGTVEAIPHTPPDLVADVHVVATVAQKSGFTDPGSVTFTPPSAVAVGDVMMLSLACNGTVTKPSAWTEVYTAAGFTPASGFYGGNTRIWSHKLTSGDFTAGVANAVTFPIQQYQHFTMTVHWLRGVASAPGAGTGTAVTGTTSSSPVTVPAQTATPTAPKFLVFSAVSPGSSISGGVINLPAATQSPLGTYQTQEYIRAGLIEANTSATDTTNAPATNRVDYVTVTVPLTPATEPAPPESEESQDPLAPFGQVIKLWVQIDKADGTWFPRLKMGEYPIQTTTREWPGKVQTVEAADYSWLVDAYIYERLVPQKHKTIRQAVEDIVKEALPETEFFIQSPGDAHTVKVEAHTVSQVGMGRWEFAQAICAARGFECFFNHNGNLVIRHDITNAEDDVETIPGEGPDIGTVTNPAAVIRDGIGGNLRALTVGLTREGACNGVFVNLHETASKTLAERKVEEADTGTVEPDPDDELADGGAPVPDDDPESPPVPDRDPAKPEVSVQVKALGTGPIKWGDKFGRQNIVLDRNVKRINPAVINTQRRRAKRLLNRRGGVIRSVDLDAVGLYWLEPDDKVRVKYDGRTEAHYVASIEFDLAGEEPARIRTRSLTVMEPG